MTTRSRQRVRRAVTKAALVGTAVAAALTLTATEASATVGAGVQVATFTLAQADWSGGYYGYNGNNGFEITLQTDGNFVLYNGSGSPVWASGTNGKGVTHLDWSQSGYVKLEDSNNNIVCTLGALNPAPGGQAVLQNDGNFVFYDVNGNATWATGTYNGRVGNLNYCYT